MKKLTFNPVISFDGVAIIVASVTCAIWFGSLSATVSGHTDAIKHLSQIQETQAETLKLMSQQIGILQGALNGKLGVFKP